MSGISSKALAFGSPQNKYKFNGGNELQSGEFNDGSGLEMFDAVNRMYDPQIGRFWQIDELGEANWEESPYSFSHNAPILFNDPLGLDPETSTPDKPKELQEVVLVALPKGFWAKQRLYYDIMNQLNRRGATIDQIMQPSLREMMYRYDGITKFRERVADMTRESDKIVLEIGAWFIPTGWLLKLKYVKLAAKLLQFKRGEKAAFSIFSYITKKIAGQMAKRGWTKEAIHAVINNPYATRESVNLATGNAATTYFEKEGAYVVKDNITNEIIQISDKTKEWAVDKNIVNPYIPKQ